jgi:prepilin-type N-terminal cleavage/methylation domain-containing protein
MKGGNQPHGFTIVETLIVLAVTGVLFISAAAAISGRQGKTEFQVAINNLQQQLQQIINETTSGYSTTNADYSCTTAGLHQPVTIRATASAPPQGTNQGCIFLGKTIWFGGPAAGSDNSIYIFPLAGNKYAPGSTNEVTTYGDAWPTAVAPGSQPVTNGGTLGINAAPTDDTATYTLAGGLQYVWGASNGSLVHITWPNPVAIALLSSLGSYASSGTSQQLSSGSSSLGLYGYMNTWTSGNTDTVAHVVDNIDNLNPTATLNTASGIVNGSNLVALRSIELCFSSGTTKQSGEITIGPVNTFASGLTVSTKIFNTLDCS